jgi:hypothetical protein
MQAMVNAISLVTRGKEWLRRRWLDICALSAVILILVSLLHFDRAATRISVATKEAASQISGIGSLSGWLARDSKEWSASPPGVALLFNVAPKGQIGDQRFWERVASGINDSAAPVQLVGLCSPGKVCDELVLEQGPITYLTAMDPIQMAALALAARDHFALLYQIDPYKHLLANSTVSASGKLIQRIEITTDSGAFLDQLQRHIGKAAQDHR